MLLPMNPAQPVTKHRKQGSVSQEFSANAHSNIVADYTGKSLNVASSSTGLASEIHFSLDTASAIPLNSRESYLRGNEKYRFPDPENCSRREFLCYRHSNWNFACCIFSLHLGR